MFLLPAVLLSYVAVVIFASWLKTYTFLWQVIHSIYNYQKITATIQIQDYFYSLGTNCLLCCYCVCLDGISLDSESDNSAFSQIDDQEIPKDYSFHAHGLCHKGSSPIQINLNSSQI